METQYLHRWQKRRADEINAAIAELKTLALTPKPRPILTALELVPLCPIRAAAAAAEYKRWAQSTGNFYNINAAATAAGNLEAVR